MITTAEAVVLGWGVFLLLLLALIVLVARGRERR